jgi:glycosyltransferase involved in cell wall biosynthesis
LWRYPIEYFYGAQALAFSTEDAQHLAEWLGTDPQYQGKRDRHHDLLLQDWGRELGLTHFAASVPCFVQHVGEESSLGNSVFRFDSWPGHDWRYRGRRRQLDQPTIRKKKCSSLKILWVGDSPNVNTGFARCTRAACHALIEAGHQVSILGINEPGDSLTDDTGWSLPPTPSPYVIYRPANALDGGQDGFGATRLPRLIHRLSPDLVVLLSDPWNIHPYLEHIACYAMALCQSPGVDKRKAWEQAERVRDTPILAWLAVDGCNQKGEELAGLSHVAVWTEFGKNELASGGYQGPCEVIPLGVDVSLFHPMDYSERLRARATLTNEPISESAFLVGVVGRNQPRKRIDLAIACFAEWIRNYDVPNAYLYLHTAPTGERGCDIRALAKYYDLRGRLILAEQLPGMGITDEDLVRVYQSLDVYLSTTQGEGWGLPALEAMACGVPCVLPDWSAFGDWAKGTAFLIPCPSTALTAPLNASPYTLGGVVDRQSLIETLNKLYDPANRRRYYDKYGKLGRRCAEGLTWERTGAGVVSWVERAYDIANAASQSPGPQSQLAATGAATGE